MLLECTNSGMQKNIFRFKLLNAWKCERNPKLTYSPIDVLFRFFLFLTRLVSALPRIARTPHTTQPHTAHETEFNVCVISMD